MSGSSELDPKVAGEEQAQDPPERVEEAEPSFFAQPRRIAQTLLVVLILVGAIYVLLPKIVGIEDALATLDQGNPWWIAVAVAFNFAAFGAYVALFRGVVGEQVLHLDWRESYQITMAGLAATRLFSAGGAGGIILTYWALRKAGMERRQSACRMVAFLALLYGVYLAALVIFGVLLRSHVLPGQNPIGLTIVPAALAGAVIVIFLLIALIPEDMERRMARFTQGYRFGRFAQRLATAPATLASGTRTALTFVRDPRRGGRVLGRQHRDPVGQLRGVLGRRPPGGAGTGLLRRDGRQPVPVRPRRRRRGRRGTDRHLRPLPASRLRRVRRRADLPADRLLAPDSARDRCLPPATEDRRAVGPGARAGHAARGRRGRRGRQPGRADPTSKSKVIYPAGSGTRDHGRGAQMTNE